jgi:hypothetical protein
MGNSAMLTSVLSLSSPTLSSFVIAGLGSASIAIRRVAAAFLLNLFTSATKRMASEEVFAACSDDFVVNMLQSLSDEDTKVADTISESVVVMCGGSKQDRQLGRVMGLICRCINAPDSATPATPAPSEVDRAKFASLHSVVQARWLTLATRLAAAGSDMFALVAATGLISLMFDMVSDDSDPLMQLTLLDLVVHVCETEAGTSAFLGSGLWAKLLLWSGTGSRAADGDPILGINALSALGSTFNAIAVACPQALAPLRQTLQGTMLPHIASLCESGRDTTETVAAIQCVSLLLGADPKFLEFAVSSEKLPFMREWLECAISSTPELRIACFVGLSHVFNAASRFSDQENAFLALFALLTTCWGCEPGEAALSCLKKPHHEARVAAYRFLAALAGVPYVWGPRRVLGTPDLGPYLLDRSTEISKDGKEWKFAVLDALVRNKHARESVGDYLYSQLIAFHAKGPFHVEQLPASVLVASRT